MLRSKTISLRAAEKEDADTLAEWFNNPEFSGDFQHFPIQVPKAHLERRIVDHSLYGAEWVDFIASDSEGKSIGWIAHYTAAPNFGWLELGIAICPEHRNKGYASEAISTLTDYLFLSRDQNRIQAVADRDNDASIRAFEKSGFVKEGVLRKALWNRDGRWGDGVMLGILREDWGHPRILTR
jgi:RimJ/RimL family protein N-acetyltransferase